MFKSQILLARPGINNCEIGNQGRASGRILRQRQQFASVTPFAYGFLFASDSGIDLAEKAPCRRVIGLIVDELFRDSEGAITHTPGRVRSPHFPKAASHLAIPRAMVTQVAEDTPAADAGLKEGDVLLQLEKKKISDPEDVFDASFYITAGDTVPITVMRGDQK